MDRQRNLLVCPICTKNGRHPTSLTNSSCQLQCLCFIKKALKSVNFIFVCLNSQLQKSWITWSRTRMSTAWRYLTVSSNSQFTLIYFNWVLAWYCWLIGNTQNVGWCERWYSNFIWRESSGVYQLSLLYFRVNRRLVLHKVKWCSYKLMVAIFIAAASWNRTSSRSICKFCSLFCYYKFILLNLAPMSTK